MVNLRIALLGVSLGMVGVAAQADPLCDCSKIVGQCAASIKMKSLSGAKPSFTANYSITSTTASCSKVSYYIDGTPYFNVLAGTNHAEESTFGIEPITMKNFSGIKCEVCADQKAQKSNENQAGGTPNTPSAQGRDQYNGTWRTDLYTLNISNAATNPQIGYHFDKVQTNTQGSADDGRFEGDTLVFSWSMGLFGRNSCRFRVTGQNTAVANCGNFTGSHTKKFTRM